MDKRSKTTTIGHIPKGFKRHPVFKAYAISKSGECWSIFFQRKIKTSENQQGYLLYSLYLNGKVKRKTLSSLVLETYIGPRPYKFEAAHLDGNRNNNKLKNLKWSSKIENESHKIKHGTAPHGSKNGRAKLSEEDAFYIINNYKSEPRKWSNAKELAKKFNVCPSHIKSVARNKRDWSWLKKAAAEKMMGEL